MDNLSKTYFDKLNIDNIHIILSFLDNYSIYYSLYYILNNRIKEITWTQVNLYRYGEYKNINDKYIFVYSNKSLTLKSEHVYKIIHNLYNL